MKMLRPLLVLLLTLGLAGAASADQRQMALGSQGEIYRVLSGAYGDFFTDGSVDPANQVLVVQVTQPAGEPELLLVPGTEGEEYETSATLVFERASDALFVLWEGRRSFIHSRIFLTSLVHGSFTQTIELSGDVFSQKTSPTLAVTRDTLVVEEAGELVEKSRTIYHTLWWEEAGLGDRVVYAPVVLVDGEYIGRNPVFVLNELGFGDELTAEPVLTDELARSPAIQPGADGASVVAAFADPTTGQLVTLELETVTGEMDYLAEAVRADLVAGGQGMFPGNMQGLSDRARHQLVDIGLRLGMHPGMIKYLGDSVADLVAASGEPTLPGLADRARHQLVDIGARMAAQGLTSSADDSETWIVEFTDGASPGPPSEQTLYHSVRLRLAAVRPLPETEPAPTALDLSENGAEALVAWQVEDQLRYRETEDGGWSEVHVLELSPELDAEAAYRLLQRRTRNR